MTKIISRSLLLRLMNVPLLRTGLRPPSLLSSWKTLLAVIWLTR
ncbi:MAG: hypothetical protein V2A65_08335 [Candidatus Omnitrophota bacterium]